MPREIVIGNGLALATFDACASLRELYFPYVGLMNQTMGRPCALGVRVDGEVSWLSSARWRKEARLGADGRSASFAFAHPALDLELHGDIRWDPGDRILRRHLTFRGGRRQLRVLAHHDFCLGESDLGQEVRAFPKRGYLEHGKGGDRVRLEFDGPKGPGFSDWTLGRRDDFGGIGVRAAADREALGRNPCAVGAGESIIAYDLDLDGTHPAEVVLTMSIECRRSELLISSSIPTAAESPPPLETPGLTDEMLALEAQSMGQLAAHQDQDGAIIAAADAWNLELAWEHYAYCWPRDGAFVARAMDQGGRSDLAARFFEFAEATVEDGGFFLQRYRPDGHRASSWHAEPGEGEDHLPIQSDETALVLWSLGRHLEKQAAEVDGFDPDRHWPFLREMAEFLATYRDEETKLPLPSHDLWEERFGVHTFGVAAKEAALRQASKLAHTRGASDDATRWENIAEEFRVARRRYLFHEDAGRYARRAVKNEEGYFLDMTPDASLAGLFLFESGGKMPEETIATMDAVRRATLVPGPIGGHARYVDDSYERREDDPAGPGNPWVICSLWLAEWDMERAGTRMALEGALQQISWVLQHRSQSGALAEQFDPTTGSPRSVMPLTWSHAAYVSALARYRNRYAALGR